MEFNDVVLPYRYLSTQELKSIALSYYDLNKHWAFDREAVSEAFADTVDSIMRVYESTGDVNRDAEIQNGIVSKLFKYARNVLSYDNLVDSKDYRDFKVYDYDRQQIAKDFDKGKGKLGIYDSEIYMIALDRKKNGRKDK